MAYISVTDRDTRTNQKAISMARFSFSMDFEQILNFSISNFVSQYTINILIRVTY